MCWSLFLMKLLVSYEICEVFKNTFLDRATLVDASEDKFLRK